MAARGRLRLVGSKASEAPVAAEPPRLELVAALEKLRADFGADDGELLAAVRALPKKHSGNDVLAALLALPPPPRRRGRKDAKGDDRLLFGMMLMVAGGKRPWPAARGLLAGVPADRRDEAARRLCRKFRDPRWRGLAETWSKFLRSAAVQQALGEIRSENR